MTADEHDNQLRQLTSSPPLDLCGRGSGKLAIEQPVHPSLNCDRDLRLNLIGRRAMCQEQALGMGLISGGERKNKTGRLVHTGSPTASSPVSEDRPWTTPLR